MFERFRTLLVAGLVTGGLATAAVPASADPLVVIIKCPPGYRAVVVEAANTEIMVICYKA